MCSCHQTEFMELYRLAFHSDVQLRGTDSEQLVPARLDRLRKLKSAPLDALLDAPKAKGGDGSSADEGSSPAPKDDAAGGKEGDGSSPDEGSSPAPKDDAAGEKEGDGSSADEGPPLSLEDGVMKLPGTRRALQLLVQSLYDTDSREVLPDTDASSFEALGEEDFDDMTSDVTSFIELATALGVPDKVEEVCGHALENLEDRCWEADEVDEAIALFLALERGAKKASENDKNSHRHWWSGSVDSAARWLMHAVQDADDGSDKIPIAQQSSFVRSLTLDQLAILVNTQPVEVAKPLRELDAIEETLVLKPGVHNQINFSGHFGDGAKRTVCACFVTTAENKNISYFTSSTSQRDDNCFSGRFTLVHPKDASQSRFVDFEETKGQDLVEASTATWLIGEPATTPFAEPKAEGATTAEAATPAPAAAAEAPKAAAVPFVKQLIDAGLAEADKQLHTAKMTFRLTMTEHQSTQKLQLLRKWAELQGCAHPCLAAPPPRPANCEAAEARAQAPGLLALLLHFEQLVPPPAEKDRHAADTGAFAPQAVRASQLRATFLDEALFVHASQPSMLPALLRQPDAAQLPAELLSGILSARTAHNTAAEEGELLEALHGWSAAHTTDELARVVPSLQLEVLPLAALRRHAQPQPPRGLFHAAGEHAGLRRALCAKVLPVEGRLATHDDDEPPPSLTCPISLDLMVDPVVASDGFTYEKAAMTKFFAALKPGDGHGRSPLTHAPLTSRTLVPSNTVKTLVGEYKERRKRPRPQACAETLVMEALLPSSSSASPPKKPRVFGAERTNAGGCGIA